MKPECGNPCGAYKQRERKLKPFQDPYFKDLDYKTIAELAKKSIRLTSENRRIEEENATLAEQVAELKEENKELKMNSYLKSLRLMKIYTQK